MSRGVTRIHWLDQGYAQTREALDRCSLSLEREIAAIQGFQEEPGSHDLTIEFYGDTPEADMIRSTLIEGTLGSIAAYTIHNKGQIDWWHVKVTGVEDLAKLSEEEWPRFRITLKNV